MNYREATEYIEGMVRFTEKHSNEHTRLCLSLLGDPDKAFDSIHIAGTNGKGSTCAFLASVLNRGGFRTGRFISPHLIRVNERISVNDCDISDEDFLTCFHEVLGVSKQMEERGEGHPSYFEFLFLMAMVYFQRSEVDVAVIETGLGGRLDATNAIETPSLTVLTPIGMDHMQYLGNTPGEIAREKAGIMKPGVPCVAVAHEEEIREIYQKEAERKQTEVVFLSAEAYRIGKRENGKIDFLTRFRYDEIQHYQTEQKGIYQGENAALALLGIRELKRNNCRYDAALTPEVLREGIRNMRWPGRMEEVLPGVYLDGAHNDQGIKGFTDSVRAISGNQPSVLLFAVVNDKDVTEMVRILSESRCFREVIVSEAGGDRKTDGSDVAELFRSMGIGRVRVIPDATKAYTYALSNRSENECLFVCGSLYLIGLIKELTHDQL